MSGLPLIADMRRTDLDVGFVPTGDISNNRSKLGLAALFEQSERAPQRVRRRLALVVGHAVCVEFEPQMRRTSLFRVLLQPDHHIRRYRPRDAFDLNVAPLLAAHLVLHVCVGLE